MLVILTLGRLRQEDHPEFGPSLDYMVSFRLALIETQVSKKPPN